VSGAGACLPVGSGVILVFVWDGVGVVGLVHGGMPSVLAGQNAGIFGEGKRNESIAEWFTYRKEFGSSYQVSYDREVSFRIGKGKSLYWEWRGDIVEYSDGTRLEDN